MLPLHGTFLYPGEFRGLCYAVPTESELPGAAASAGVDIVTEAGLPAALAGRLAGTPAAGASSSAVTISSPDAAASKVIWVDAGDGCLVHLDSLHAKVLDRLLLISVDLETDQTGRATLVVSLALGGDGDLAGLVATTDELPRGNGLLAARWGRILQDAVWAALLGMAQDFARLQGGIPAGISAVPGVLKFTPGDTFASVLGVRT